MYRASYCNVLITNEMHSSYDQFLFHSFCLLSMLWMNLIIHYQEHGIIYCITQSGTIVQASVAAMKLYVRLTYNFIAARLACTIVPNCVIQYIIPCSWWCMTRFVRNRADKNCGIEIDHKICASRRLLTHYILLKVLVWVSWWYKECVAREWLLLVLQTVELKAEPAYSCFAAYQPIMPHTLQYPVCHRVDDTYCYTATSVAMCCVLNISILKRIFVWSCQVDKCLDVRNNKLFCNFCLLSLIMCNFVSGYKRYFKS